MRRVPTRAVVLAAIALLSACGGSAPCPRCPGPGAAGGAGAAARAETPDDPFLAQWSATGGFRAGRPTSISVTPDGTTVLFLRSGPRDNVRDLHAFDIAAGTERVLLTASSILGGATETLSPEERARRERLRLSARGIAHYELSRDGRFILVPLSGRLFLVERATGSTRELATGDAYPNDAHLSPDGARVAFVHDSDLWVLDVAATPGTAPRRLTTRASPEIENATPEFVAQEEMGRYQGYWWSPDSRSLAYQETDHTGVERMHVYDPTHPEQPATATPWPRAGRRNDSVRLGIVAVTGGATQWLDWDRARHPYLATVTWEPNAPLTILVQNREQSEQVLLVLDAASRRFTPIHVERDEAWLNLDQSVPRWVEPGRSFLWSTERGGAWQLELRRTDGTATPLTPADLGYRALLHLDARAGHAFVLAGASPIEDHVVRVPLDPARGRPAALTTVRGEHSAAFPDEATPATTWVEHHRPWDGPERWIVHRPDGSAAGELRSLAEPPPFAPNVELVEIGAPRFRASVVRPRDFDRTRRYPVLLSVYGGPHSNVVSGIRSRYLHAQWLADHGFIVASLDGRGTPGRGRAWERALRSRVGDVPLEDQTAGLRALLARYPEMDGSRVGIFGWSFGGYLAALAVMRRPDVFRAAVAGAPVADWTDYDTHYTERYLGLPDRDPAAYERASLLTHAASLRRPLLIIHGTVDDNVYFTHAIKLSNALFRAGRPHHFLPLSGFTHMVTDTTATQRMELRIIDFFRTELR